MLTLTGSALLTVAMQIRHVAAPDWNASSRNLCVLPKSIFSPPDDLVYDFRREPGMNEVLEISLILRYGIIDTCTMTVILDHAYQEYYRFQALLLLPRTKHRTRCWDVFEQIVPTLILLLGIAAQPLPFLSPSSLVLMVHGLLPKIHHRLFVLLQKLLHMMWLLLILYTAFMQVCAIGYAPLRIERRSENPNFGTSN